MRLSHLCLTAAAGTAAAVLAVPHPARAADAVYGGSAHDGHAVVVKADAKATKLKSIAVSWSASCADGDDFPLAIELTAVKPAPGFAPSGDELLMSRNAKRRFKGTQLASFSTDTRNAAVQVTVDGKLAGRRAGGRLSALVKISDRATGAELTSCQATQRWDAMRRPGVVYGGTTSQGEPFVVRLNATRKRVNDVLTGWHADCSQGGFGGPDRIGNFAVKRSGAFGNPFSADTTMDAGEKLHFDYAFAGRLSAKQVRGTLQVKVAITDPAGTPVDSCDTGGLTFKATTG
jgi:hypothetical protein